MNKNDCPYNSRSSPGREETEEDNPAQQLSDGVHEGIFRLGDKYKLLRFIGEGAYGVVISAIDKRAKLFVAIKATSPFAHQVYCQRSLREIRILRRFKHENIIDLRDIIIASTSDSHDIYIVQTLMETDLSKLLRTQTLSKDHTCYFLYQILRGLKYIHSSNVIHRDLKPNNLLLNKNCELKICDFGLSRIAVPHKDHQGIMTEYVATRWYRAPEIMLQSRRYDKPIDLWSVGCIFAEMITRKHLFPGRHYLEQISLILDLLGTPNERDLSWIKNEKARSYLLSLPRKENTSFQIKFDSAEPRGVDMLEKLLKFNPSERVTVEEALRHPYLSHYHDSDDEPACDEPFTYEEEIDEYPKEKLRSMILNEIKLFKADERSHSPREALPHAADNPMSK